MASAEAAGSFPAGFSALSAKHKGSAALRVQPNPAAGKGQRASLTFASSLCFRMVGDEEDEEVHSDSEGNAALTVDDLAKK